MAYVGDAVVCWLSGQKVCGVGPTATGLKPVVNTLRRRLNLTTLDSYLQYCIGKRYTATGIVTVRTDATRLILSGQVQHQRAIRNHSLNK